MDKKTISVQDLQEMLNQKHKPFILDVRPTEQRKDWRIAESYHLNVYEQLNQGDERVFDEVDIPAGAPVITVCAAGRTSLMAMEALRKKGITAFSLEGGMKSWNYAWNTAEMDFPSGLKVIQVRRPAKGVLSYIAGVAGEAVVIDAALDPQVYMELAEKNGWEIKYVMDTHIHADYVSRTRDLSRKSGASHLLIENAAVDFKFTPFRSGESVKLGNATVEFIHTPGHTLESTTFRIGDDTLFTGDTLFIDSVGRPDLKAGEKEVKQKARKLFLSLQKLMELPGSVRIMPAHVSTPIAFGDALIERSLSDVKAEVAILRKDEREFVEEVTERVPPPPPNYLTIATLNKKGDYEGHVPAELEAGGNRCAVAHSV